MTRSLTRLALGLSAMVAVAACTSAATPSPSATQAVGTPGASASAAGPTATPLPGSKKFVVAFAPRGISAMPMMQAIADLTEQGYQIDTPEIAQTNLIVEGIVGNQFQVTSTAVNSTLLAAQKGGAIKIVGNRLNNEWTLTSKADITTCAQTAGKVWAHQTESSSSTVMARSWVAKNCPGTKASEIFLQGSDVRANALRQGQIDIGELELGDAIATTSGDLASKFHVLAAFSTDLPNLKVTTIAGNTEWMANNPGDIIALLRQNLIENGKVNADPSGGYLKSLWMKFAPKTVPASGADEIAQAYVNLKLFPNDGGLTAEDLDYTIKFFTDAGTLQPGLTVPQAADLTFLDLARKAAAAAK